jgi:hypothetical protein
VNVADFTGERRDQMTVYLLLGAQNSAKSVCYFIVKNHEVAKHVHSPSDWKQYGFMSMTPAEKYEDQWDLLRTIKRSASW